MTAKSDLLIEELVSAAVAFGREKEPDWQTRIEKARVAVLDYITELEESRKWIPVSERLPECSSENLVLALSLENETYDVGYCDSEDGTWRNYDENYDSWWSPVTHWMPLPFLPTEANDGIH